MIGRQQAAIFNGLTVTDLRKKFEHLDPDFKEEDIKKLKKAELVAKLVDVQIKIKQAQDAQNIASQATEPDLKGITDRFRSSLTSLKEEAKQAAEDGRCE